MREAVPDTGAVGVVITGEQGGAAGVARREVGQTVGSAHRLDVVHVALTAKVAGVGQVDLKSLRGVFVVTVGHCGARHGYVVAAKEEEQSIAE